MNRKIITILFAVAAFTSCIKNDFPKPTVDLYIASLDVEGTEGDIVIDRSTYTATIPLAETTDIENVKFNSITYDAEVITNIPYEADASKIVVSKNLNNETINMSQPEIIYLSYYQVYEWKIVATQTINRNWRVEGQMGSTIWDIDGHRAIVKMRNDLDDVKTTTLRLGPDNYHYPTIAEMNSEIIAKEVKYDTLLLSKRDTLFNVNCKVQNVTVVAHGRDTKWHLITIPTEPTLTIKSCVPGANVIWVKADEIQGSNIEICYRKKGETDWIKADNQWYATDANNPYNRREEGYIKVVIRGLEPNTEYEVSGYTDNKLSEEEPKLVKTSSPYQMPNSDMEQWSQLKNDGSTPTSEKGPCWYPFSSLNDMFWATGNPGGTSLGPNFNLTTPVYRADDEENVAPGSMSEISAYMGSQNVLNMKFAAGNLFVGHYGETIGTNATVFFGRPLSEDVKPVAMRFWVKYSQGSINCVGDAGLNDKAGTKDLVKVFICLTDWKEPHCVNSKDKTTFFDPHTAEGVLGLGYFDTDSNPELMVENTAKWHQITLPIEYSVPEDKEYTDWISKQLVVTFTCSGYGDYFTGSDASWMYVDNIELLYDLDDSNQPK